MVLVDTSVWVDFFNGAAAPEVERLAVLLEEQETVAYTGLILQEILQGVAGDRAASAVDRHFAPFVEIFPQRTTHLLAAKLSRDCRQRGFTIRSSIDCLLAACAIETGCHLHHKDRDFVFLARVSPLKLVT